MRNIKTFKQFFEDAYATGCVGGAGGVVSAPVGSIPGVAAGSGSGDIGFVLGGTSTKTPVGGPSEVSDLRYLEEPKDIEKVDDTKKKKEKKKKADK